MRGRSDTVTHGYEGGRAGNDTARSKPRITAFAVSAYVNASASEVYLRLFDAAVPYGHGRTHHRDNDCVLTTTFRPEDPGHEHAGE
jgi:hypothetical protein